MENETPESAIPKDFFTKLFEPTGKNELEKPITPPGSRISKALASELNVKADKPEVANDWPQSSIQRIEMVVAHVDGFRHGD